MWEMYTVPMYFMRIWQAKRASGRKMGVLAQEMETMSLYCTAARAGKKALTMLTVGSSIHSSKALTNEEREEKSGHHDPVCIGGSLMKVDF